MFRMQFLLLAGAVLAGVSGFSFNRNDECPTVQDGVTAFEDHFGTQVSQQRSLLEHSPTVSCFILLSLAQIPDGLMDCVLGGDNCPFEDFDDFAEWFETTTGIPVGRLFHKTIPLTLCLQMPEPEEEDLEVLGECLTEGTNCPSLDDLHDFVQEEFGYNPSGDIITLLSSYISFYITHPSDEEIAMIENCAESWLQQLGVNI